MIHGFTAPSGARVFASGAMQFSWALDDWRSEGTIAPVPAIVSDRIAPADPRVQQFMRNALDDLTRPAAPQGMTLTQSTFGVTVSVAPDIDPRARGFVARIRSGTTWLPLCRGVTTCTGRRRVAAGPTVVGAVELDLWNRRSAPDYAVTTITRTAKGRRLHRAP